MTKPSFICIGPGRCATSWMFKVLDDHPEIGMSKIKETEYFNTNFSKGSDWYESQFPDGDYKAFGEISNNYYLDSTVAKKVYSHNPETKIVISVRRIEDLFSSFVKFYSRRGHEFPDLDEALMTPFGKIMGSGYSHRESRNELTESDKRTLLEAIKLDERFDSFLQYFPRENCYFFVYERLGSDSEKVVKELYEFIGVDSSFVPKGYREVMNQSVEPKSKMVARFATRFAFVLRRLGANALLSRLHSSKLVKKVLFKEGNQEQKSIALNEKTIKSLESNQQNLLKMVPGLDKWW